MKVNSIKNRRGFTVVELVVAITIIVIVSATAIGLINTQNKIHQQNYPLLKYKKDISK